jgi:RNA polymerase sigma-70 factor, ECF subfamily
VHSAGAGSDRHLVQLEETKVILVERLSTDVTELRFQEVYDTFQPKVLRYLLRLVGESDAEDLTQEVFVKIGQRLETFRGEARLSTWVYRVATNAALDRLRSASFRQEVRTSSLNEADETECEDIWQIEEAPSLEQQLMRQEMQQCFGSFVRDLPANYRTVIVLSELEEMTNKEIAEILNLSLDTVKIRLHRGRSLLFQELKSHCKAEEWL